MRVLQILPIALCSFGLAMFTACSGDVDVHSDDVDTTATMEGRGDTTSVGEAVGNAGQEIKTESIETVVETKLLAMPGFGEVDVESKGDGVIVLIGMVASEDEKMQAQKTAEGTEGVKSVINNLTIK